MAKIQELTESLANQIAAGEVVERPASVVKELVENAIDALSTQIDIQIEEAGLAKIIVKDNGEGILAEDVENAFKRHATSKIHSSEDLFRIRTLGFRGEALPSIASVSKMTVETSTGTGIGTLLELSGGKKVNEQANALRKGTKITVAELFFNTPARLKYVKSLQTELARIGDIVNRLALSHPHIAFRLVHDGHQMLSTTGSGELKQAIAGIYGVATAKKMREIHAADLDFKVGGYVSLPEVTRASRNYLSIMINGRYIKNYALNKAIIEGYGSKLMVGRFPLAVLAIEMDPLLVDVNVHPTKQEVRLSKEAELTRLVAKAIQTALKEENLIPQVDEKIWQAKRQAREPKAEQIRMPLDEEPLAQAKTVQRQSNENLAQALRYNPLTGEFYTEKAALSSRTVTKEEPQKDSAKTDDKNADPYDMSAWMPASARRYLAQQEESGEKIEEFRPEIPLHDPAEGPATQSVFEVEAEPQPNHPDLSAAETQQLASKLLREPEESLPRFPALEYFGQMHGTYLFAQGEQGLYIIDQHAAQERIKYEQYRKEIAEVSDHLQELLVPLVLDYTNEERIQLQAHQQELEAVGLYLEPFGQNSFLVRAHPTWFPEGQEEATIRDLLDMALTTGKIDLAKFREATAIMMSCKRSIKANHYLNVAQAQQLLKDLRLCENPFNCPHGRPVLVHFTNQDMEKMFKRIQDPHQTKSFD